MKIKPFSEKKLKKIDAISRIADSFVYKITDASNFSLPYNHKLRHHTVNELYDMHQVATILASVYSLDDDQDIIKYIKSAEKKWGNLATHCRENFPAKIHNFLDNQEWKY